MLFGVFFLVSALALRVKKIKTFQVMALLEQAQRMESCGRDVIHMEVGEPDFPTPEPIVAAAQEALAAGRTKYTPAAGLPELRCAIARYYDQRYGVEINPARILITPGASGALSLVTALLFNPADGVLLSDPGYPCNSSFLHLINAEPQPISVSEHSGFQLTAELVDRYWQASTQGVMIATPSNPTGTLSELHDLSQIKAAVDRRNGALLVDEIYQELVYDTKSKTALSLTDEENSLFVINSFSKYFCMTGWRLGWLVAPESLVPDLEKMAQNFYLAAPTLSQYAAMAAFLPETLAQLDANRDELRRRRNFLLSRLPALGFKVPVTPQGAFYLYADVSQLTDDSVQFCQRLLSETGVAITPGFDFGENAPLKYVRFAYTCSIEHMDDALQRIERFVNG